MILPVAVKSIWTVDHSCGHRQDHDLSEKRISERAGFARWLEQRECSDCWQAKRDHQNANDRDAWIAEQRAKESSEVDTWERASGMPVLEGSEKAKDWGRRVRYTLMTSAHAYAQQIGVSDEDFAEEVEEPAAHITSASWWIDQRDSAAEDVPELVQDGFEPASHSGLENPY